MGQNRFKIVNSSVKIIIEPSFKIEIGYIKESSHYEETFSDMKIWVDADACPKVIKEILFRAAERIKIPVILVANNYLNVPPSAFISVMQVADGFDIADDKIVELCETGHLVITADIPLAARAIEKGGFALNPRGTFYDTNNIGPILAARNFAHQNRSMMSDTIEGPAGFTVKDRELFSNALDKFIRRKTV